MTVSADDVRAAYRFIFGREPETEEAVTFHQAAYADIEALRHAFFRLARRPRPSLVAIKIDL